MTYTSYIFGTSAIIIKFLYSNRWPRFFKACGLYVKEDKEILSPSLVVSNKTIKSYNKLKVIQVREDFSDIEKLK